MYPFVASVRKPSVAAEDVTVPVALSEVNAPVLPLIGVPVIPVADSVVNDPVLPLIGVPVIPVATIVPPTVSPLDRFVGPVAESVVNAPVDGVVEPMELPLIGPA